MKKKIDKGKVLFFIGVVIFFVVLGIGYFSDINAVIIDLIMGVGLLLEFIGLCIVWKNDKKDSDMANERLEEKTIEKIKVSEKNKETKEVVEVDIKNKLEEKDTKEEKKKNQKVQESKKTTTKDKNGTKKTTPKKKTTKKKTTSKKTASKKNK